MIRSLTSSITGADHRTEPRQKPRGSAGIPPGVAIFTEDPNVAASLESDDDFYARLLLVAVLGAVTLPPSLARPAIHAGPN
jgi:hypothetical protein